MTGGEAPIGFWLKHLDGLLERQPAAELADHGLLRRHWQVLNTLSRSPARRGQLAEALAPFWNDSEGPSLDEVLAALADRGWTASGGAEAPDEEDGTLALTAPAARPRRHRRAHRGGPRRRRRRPHPRAVRRGGAGAVGHGRQRRTGPGDR